MTDITNPIDPIDVIVVAFNRPKETEETIKSLLKANENIRVIFIDNNSTDKYIVEPDKRITPVYLTENIGQARAVNLGLSMAKSEYVCFMHNDLVINDKNWLDKAVSFLKKNPYAGLVELYGSKVIEGKPRTITSLRGHQNYLEPDEDFVEVAAVDEMCNIFKNDGLKADERYGLTSCGIWVDILGRGQKLYVMKLKDGEHFQTHSKYDNKSIKKREDYLRKTIRVLKKKEAGLLKLYIFGAGGGALHILQDGNWYFKDKQLEFEADDIIFVEDNAKSDFINISGTDYKLVSFDDLKLTEGFGHISAFNIEYKERMSKLRLVWINSYSKNYVRFPGIDIGPGVRINLFNYIDGNVKIGKFVKLNSFVFIGHGSSVGDYSYISQGVVLDNNVQVGSRCYIFENSTLLPGIRIGDNTIIGAGSVVTKDIPSGVTAYGNPCKVVRIND